MSLLWMKVGNEELVDRCIAESRIWSGRPMMMDSCCVRAEAEGTGRYPFRD